MADIIKACMDEFINNDITEVISVESYSTCGYRNIVFSYIKSYTRLAVSISIYDDEHALDRAILTLRDCLNRRV